MSEIGIDALNRWHWRPDLMVRELFGATPDEWQDEVLQALPYNPRIAMKACKNPGKTACEAWCAWNFLLTRLHPRMLATSMTAKNLEDGLWTEMAKWMNLSPILKSTFEWTKQRITHRQYPETWWMSARTWPKKASAEEQADTLAGLHADYTMAIIDECGDIPPAVLVAAEAMLGSGIESHVLIGGNCNSRDGMLYHATVTSRGKWHVVTVTGDPDDPRRSSRVDIEWARDLIAEWGRDNDFVKVNVLGEFPTTSFMSLISMDDIEAAQARSYKEWDIEHHPRILGVDVALYGKDASVIFPRQGLVAFVPSRYRLIEPHVGAGRVAAKVDEWKVDATFVDNTGGYGASWISHLRLMGYSPIGVGFAESPNDPQYANKRAEIYSLAASWIKSGGQLPPKTVPGMREFAEAMTETVYSAPKGRLLLEPKQLISDRLGYSPDDADAFCFVGDTLIATPRGEVPILELVEGDAVTTPFGTARVAIKWTSVSAALTTATFSNGGCLTGTGKHEVFCWGEGVKRLDALCLTDRMESYSVERLFAWRALNSLSTRERSSEFRPLVDIIRETGKVRASAFCIAVCGRTITVLCQVAWRCITSMVIGVTMPSATWRFAFRVSTSGNTVFSGLKIRNSEHETWNISTRPGSPRQRGTDQKPGWSGIRGMARLHGGKGRPRESFACDVSLHSIPIGRIKPSSAQGPVPKLKRKLMGAIAPIFGRAVGAAKSLLLTVIARRSVVPVSVAQESVPPTRVYNLTLDRDNAYYANGVLVFNCLTFSQPVTAKQRRPARARHQVDWDYAVALDSIRESARGLEYDPFSR